MKIRFVILLLLGPIGACAEIDPHDGRQEGVLCSTNQRSSLILMKVLCTMLIMSIGVASPMSIWAEVVIPCDQQDQLLLRNSFIDMPAFSDTAAHEGHDSTHETNLHHVDSNNSDSSALDCECCVSCITACALSAGTHTAIDSDSMNSYLDKQSQPNPASKCIHSNPDPNSLFRPPNLNA